MEQRWNDTDSGKPNLFQSHFVNHKTHMTAQTRASTVRSLWLNCLSYDMAKLVFSDVFKTIHKSIVY
jgi:hypothetical protein